MHLPVLCTFHLIKQIKSQWRITCGTRKWSTGKRHWTNEWVTESVHDVNDRDGRPVYLPQSPSPNGHHCSTASPCCRAAPDESRLRTRNWVPSWKERKVTLLCADSCRDLTDLHNGVHRTGFLTEAAVYALGHVDVIPGGASTTIRPSLRLDGDSLRENGCYWCTKQG